MKWYVIHTKVREEFRAMENLQNQGFEVFLPTWQKQQKRLNKIKIATEPLFSRYLFIRLSDLSSNWFPIRSTRGVAQLLRFGNNTNPVIVPDLVVDYLKERCATEESVNPLFKKGDVLEITGGPFKGLLGQFEKLNALPDGFARALLLVEILGHAQKLEIALSQLKKTGI